MTTSTPVSPTLPITGIIATVGAGTGSFTETVGGVLRGPMPLPGNVRLCLAFGCAFGADVPLTQNGTRGVGIGGAPIVVTIGGLATVSLQGATWSTGVLIATTTLGITTVAGFAQGPGLVPSSTAQGGGSVQMVTPITVTTTSDGVVTVFDVFGIFNAQLVPEPASGLLLCCGVAALVLLGRARR